MSKTNTPKTRRSGSASAPRSASRSAAPQTVSAKWLLTAGLSCLLGAMACAWFTLCILFWQGSWQLLYHPSSVVLTTPVSANLAFESIGFASNAAGEPQLRGWWIPGPGQPRFTAIFFHAADQNLGDSISALTTLHDAGLNVFAFDYRGYGQSHFVHPSESRWLQDADSAITYLTGTRHVPASAIILAGRNLGANLAIEVAAKHAEFAGAIIEQPLESPTAAIFNDPRARLVPAHLLVNDKWQTEASASNMLIPSIWIDWTPERNAILEQDRPQAYEKTPARKTFVWLTNAPDAQQQFHAALTSWLDQLKPSVR